MDELSIQRGASTGVVPQGHNGGNGTAAPGGLSVSFTDLLQQAAALAQTIRERVEAGEVIPASQLPTSQSENRVWGITPEGGLFSAPGDWRPPDTASDKLKAQFAGRKLFSTEAEARGALDTNFGWPVGTGQKIADAIQADFKATGSLPPGRAEEIQDRVLKELGLSLPPPATPPPVVDPFAEARQQAEANSAAADKAQADFAAKYGATPAWAHVFGDESGGGAQTWPGGGQAWPSGMGAAGAYTQRALSEGFLSSRPGALGSPRRIEPEGWTGAWSGGPSEGPIRSTGLVTGPGGLSGGDDETPWWAKENSVLPGWEDAIPGYPPGWTQERIDRDNRFMRMAQGLEVSNEGLTDEPWWAYQMSPERLALPQSQQTIKPLFVDGRLSPGELAERNRLLASGQTPPAYLAAETEEQARIISSDPRGGGSSALFFDQSGQLQERGGF